jgi:Leucine-rich repeat (LRR) protein
MQEQQLGSNCDLSTLRYLDVSGMCLKDLGSVFAAGGPLAGLTWLNLDSNHLTSLAPLAGLTRLVALSINNNRPFDSMQASWSFAAGAANGAGPDGQAGQHSAACGSPGAARALLPSLQILQLAGCGLTSLVPLQLQCLPALRSLFVQSNDLSRLDGLEGLLQLKELVADKNRVRWGLIYVWHSNWDAAYSMAVSTVCQAVASVNVRTWPWPERLRTAQIGVPCLVLCACRVLEPDLFSGLVKLQELRLDDNAIRNINPAVTVSGGMGACFPQLRVLQLSNNRLLDPLDCANRLTGMPMLVEVSVAGNPFTRKHQVRHAIDSPELLQAQHQHPA